MVYFTQDSVPAARAALSVSEAGFWHDIRDGRPISQLKRPTFGFRVKQYFKSKSPLQSEFLPGMQGRVLHRKNLNVQPAGKYALTWYANILGQGPLVSVEVDDLWDAEGNQLRDYLHEDLIEIGTELYGNWKIDVCNIPRTQSNFTDKEQELFDNPNYQYLARGISTFLRKLAATKPDCMPQDNYDRLGGASGNKVPWITLKVLNGVEKAGLLSVLNNPEFTIKDIRANANLDCQTLAAKDEPGFYLRVYTKPIPGQSKGHGSFYVGQAKDLHNRFLGWSRPGQAHEDLIQDPTVSKEMLAICRVDMAFYQDHKYIVEQLFTSLFQTYKQAILGRTVNSGDVQTNYSIKNCADLDKIATASANDSGWAGAVRRISFWQDSFSTCEGLNYQSPIGEAPPFEPIGWLQNHKYVPDPDNPGKGKSILISNFTREKPKKMQIQVPGTKSASKSLSFIVWDLHSENKNYALRMSRTDGVEWPAENTFYNITFEVRLDWKPHPYSWARLPLIGPFKDWDRANSWAIVIEWVDKSGQNRQRYLHCERPYMTLAEDSDAAIQPYARGIEVSDPDRIIICWLTSISQVIHWLFNERIPSGQQYEWLQVPPMAAIKVIKHDTVRQMITFEAGKAVTATAPIPCSRRAPDRIKADMEGLGEHGDFKLQNVGLTLDQARKATPGKWGSRTKCDCCMFFARSAGPGPCTVEDGNIVCESCLKIFGRPFCSWTLGIPSVSRRATDLGNSFGELAAQGDTVNALRRTALHGLEGSRDEAMLAGDAQIISVVQDEEDELDAVKGEVHEV
jgi:hypothetical protein